MTTYTEQNIIANVRVAMHELGIDNRGLVIGAGAAGVLRGVREQTNDIDVAILDAAIFERCKGLGYEVKHFLSFINGEPVSSVEYPGGVSIHLEAGPWPHYESVDGIMCYSLEQLYTQYSQLNRPKDQEILNRLRAELQITV